MNDLAPGVPRELDEIEEYVCHEHKQMGLVDPKKKGTGTAVVVRVAVMP